MPSTGHYSDEFFAFHEERSRASARETIPLVLDYVRPASVVDVGCGNGTWLTEFQAAGISDLVGVDGGWVNPEKLLIDRRHFRIADLSQPLAVGRTFDLATSLEVAEHLPAEAAATFVQSLVRLAPVVLFSAAIPYQGGEGHVNEQFPDYWAALFREQDYVVVDCLRRRLWNNANVAWFYRQNLLFFVDRKRLSSYSRLAEALDRTACDAPLSLVHPEQYHAMIEALCDLRRSLMRHLVRMRKVNLIAFPDWSQGGRALEDELRGLLTALAHHPQRQELTLVIHVSGDETAAAALLSRLVEEIIPKRGQPPYDVPEISGVGRSFGQEQWEVLAECLQGRVELDHENQAMVLQSQCHGLPMLRVAEIEAGRRFSVEGEA